MGTSKRWSAATLALVLLGGGTATVRPAAGDESTPAANRRYAVAAGFQNRGLVKLAAEEWRKFAADYPKDPRRDQARHYLGACLLRDNQLDAAIAELKGLLASAPKYEQRDAVLLDLGVALFRRGNDRKNADDQRAAAETFATLVRDHPGSPQIPQALYNRAEAAFESGKVADAAAGYERLIREHPRSDLVPEATYALGVAQNQLAQNDRALATFDGFLKTFASHPLAAECRLRKGEAAFALKKYVEADTLFGQASEVKGFPLADYALYCKASSLLEQGRGLEAAEVYDRVAKLYPKGPYRAQALLAAGECFTLKGKYGDARARLAEVRALNGPEAAEASYWFGRGLLLEKKPAEALAAFEAALAKSPPPQPGPRASLLLGLADACAAVPARLPEASKRYSEFAHAFPDDPRTAPAIRLASSSALAAGQLDLARASAQEFLARFPKHELRHEVLFNLAEVELRGEHYPEAAARYQELIGSSPQSPHAEESRVRRGLALALAHRDEQVIATLAADLPHVKDPALRAHAQYLIGRAEADLGRFEPATRTLKAALDAKADWPLADENRLILAHCLRVTRHPAAAAAELRRLIASFPKSPILDQAYEQLGDCAADEGQDDPALAAYREARSRAGNGPVGPRADLGIARALYRKQDFQGAFAAADALAKSAMAGDVVGPRARYVRALASHALKQDAKAVEDLDAFLASRPEGDDALDARFLKGICQAASGRHAEAVDTFASLDRDQPKSPRAPRILYELAFSQEALKRDKDAAGTFLRLAQADPSGPLAAEAWFRVGRQRDAEGHHDEAIRAYQDALSKPVSPPLKEQVLNRLGLSLFDRGDFAAAGSTFDRQVGEFPNGPLTVDGRYRAAESLFKQRQWRPALDRFTMVAQAEPAAYHARALYRAGQAAAMLKDWPASAAFYKDVTTLFPKFEQAADARYGLGWALQNQNRFREAIESYREVIRGTESETAAKAQFMIGECLFAEKEHAEAAAQFLKAAYGYPYEEWAGNAHFEAARCFEVLKQLDQARESYRTLATRYPKHPRARAAADRLKELAE